MNLRFDMHCHPGSKAYLSHNDPSKKDDCWKIYKNLLVKITSSQASYGQLEEGNVRLAVVPVYVIEKPFTQVFLIEHIAPTLTMLHGDMLNEIQIGDGLTHLKGELETLEKSLQPDSSQPPRGQFLKSMDDFDPRKLNIILSIEGAHGIMSEAKSIEENLLELKRKDAPWRFFYLTLIHAITNPLGTHAYAIKMLKGDSDFKPAGENGEPGLTDLGKKMIDLCYDDTKGNRILIDIKHMSIESRKDFYTHRMDEGYDDIPILATHMGCTGISFNPQAIMKHVKKRISIKDNSVMVEYTRPKGIGKGGNLFRKKETHFNPWSINLYNEEIPIILDSGGIIGVNLDQRILGTKPVKGEYFSIEDFKLLFSTRGDDDLPDGFELSDKFIEEEGPESRPKPIRFNKRNHLRHVCNTILHIVKIGGARAWKQLVIGSDFDGLIDPVNNCISADELPGLEEDLPKMLEKMIEEAKKEDPSVDFFETDLQQHVRDIMFNNGFEFMKKHFK